VPAGPHVIAANHTSYLDGAVLIAALPWRNYAFVAKRELADNFISRTLVRGIGAVFVERFDVQRSAEHADALVEAARDGVSLIVFPEGTRSREGRVARFKGGSFLLALQAGLPIVPLSIVGSRHVMLKGRLATYPGTVRLVVHEPIATHDLAGLDPKEFGERVRRVIAPDAESDLDAVPPDVDALHARA
jgi:1-acyl-sn-glycerol-3-phosphate acyltransferase